MTDFFIKFAKIIKDSDRAIYAYEPDDGDTINNGKDLSAYATKKGGGNAVDGMLWAAYSVMLNPSAKAAVARGDIDVKSYFYEAMKDSYQNGITAVSDALNLDDDHYYDEIGQLSINDISTAERMLVLAKANLLNIKAGQDGYKEAVAEMDKARENMLNILLMYPSPKTMIESILNYFFHFLAGFGDGTNWRIHQEIMDGLFEALPELSLSVRLKDWWKYGASKNYHPAMIAENYFRFAVERGDIDRLEFRKDQIIKWMSTARSGRRKDDIFIARQGISDDLWDNYKEQVIEKYQKGVRLIKEGVTTWDDEDYEAAKEEEEQEVRKDRDFLELDESDDDMSSDDLTDEQIKNIISEEQNVYNDIDDQDFLGGLTKEEYEAQLMKDIDNREQQRETGPKGPNPLIEDAAEEVSESDEDSDSDLTQEQVEMYNQALGIMDTNSKLT